MELDYRALVSRADLVYLSPAAHALEGQPIGNGRMGTLVWTTPHTINMQINHSDVFAVNKRHEGSQYESTDYCNGCGWITIDLGGEPLQALEGFSQKLALYDAECTLEGLDLSARCFISSARDLLALEIDDRRPEPRPLRVTLSMWRPPEVQTGAHSARYAFHSAGGNVVLVQQFQEGDYSCSSALAARIADAQVAVQAPTPRARILTAPARKGKRLILFSCAASWSPTEDVGQTASAIMTEQIAYSYEALRQEHARWWANYWARTYIHLSSTDGAAAMMERLRTLYLYVMAATSRGTLPPKFNGMLFTTDGDKRAWGSQFWVWNTELLYFPLLAAGAIDLTDPYFHMYRNQLEDCQQASRQRWGIEGAYYPETTPFDGPAVLSEDVAHEFRDVYLGAADNTQLSERARAAGQFDSSLRVFVGRDRLAAGRYTWISHILSSGCELAVQAWWRYRYTGDQGWLREVAYPLLRETAEFYRHFARRGPDGKYHIYPTNVHERFWGVRDGIMDLAAIRGTMPLAIRAAAILKVDANLCDLWTAFLEDLTPYPLGNEPQARALTGGTLGENAWAAGYLEDVDDSRNGEQVWLTPVFPFEDWTLETPGKELAAIAQRTYDLLPHRISLLGGDGVAIWSRLPIMTARMGRSDDLAAVLVSAYAGQRPLPNGFSLSEGVQAHTVEHLAAISAALQDALLQSVAPCPGEDEVLSVFPAWPADWDAEFSLLARGGFLVSSAIRQGVVQLVEITSRLGGTCKLRNPWGLACMATTMDGLVSECTGDILVLETQAGIHYSLRPIGAPPPELLIQSIESSPGPVSYTFQTHGRTVTIGLGRQKD